MTRKIRYHDVFLGDKSEYFVLQQPDNPNFDINRHLVNKDIDGRKLIITGFNDSSHFERLKEYIKHSKKSVKLTSFIFDNTKIADLLIDKSEELNGGVYVLTSNLDRNLQRIFDYSRTDLNMHYDVLKRLSNSFVAVRMASGLHAKFWVFDDKYGTITSANLTENSLENVVEVGIKLTNRNEVKSLDRIFNKLWLNFANRELYNEFITTPSNPQITSDNQHYSENIRIHALLENRNVNWFTEDWYDAVYDFLENVNLNIKIVSYELNFQRTKLFNLLRKHLENGKQVDIVIAEYKFKKDYFQRKTLVDLQKEFENFNFLVHENNHAKFILIDDQKVFLTTKNYAPPKQYQASFELGIRVDEHIEGFLEIWNAIKTRSQQIVFYSDKEDFLFNLTKDTPETIYDKNLDVWIWHPQRPSYGYLGESPSLKEISNALKNAIYIKMFDMKDPNDYNCSKIISINRNLRLRLDRKGGLIMIDESGQYIDREKIRNSWLLGSEKITFKQFSEN